ncbi:MAG TPA: FHA domain-containing protein [Solirubrobacterales bacterium]|nr:FHA domain-containing protein [Solirubrobacterales bacterium]
MSVNRLTPAGLKRRHELERAHKSFLEHPGAEGAAEIFELPAEGRITIGRDDSAELVIEGDEQVSRVHAELERIAGNWVISDDGLSRNGTWIGSARIAGRRRLADGDAVRIGRSVLVFRDPAQADERTAAATDDPEAAAITNTQRRVLVALCRPFRDGSEFAVPATNKEIAAEVFLSIEAVKAHLRALFDRFGVSELPQNQKRLKLIENALRSGAVSPSELREAPVR